MDRPAPPADPWVADSLTLGYATPGHTLALPEPHRRRSRAPLFIAVAVVTALVAGIGAYAGATVWYGWGSTEPEDVLPATAAAFARLDLAPGLGQRVRLGSVTAKFPHGSDPDAAQQWKRDVVGEIGLDPLSYDTDIRPWFGDRIGAATWSYDRRPCTVVAMASTDDGKARTALERVRRSRPDGRFGFAFEQGYAVFGSCDRSSQAVVDAAVAAPPLGERPEFADGLSALPAGQVVVVWADRLADAWAALPATARPAGLSALTGQLIAGAQAGAEGVDVRLRLTGGAAAPATRDVLGDLAALPTDVAVGVSADLSGLGPASAGPLAGIEGVSALLGSVLSVAWTSAQQLRVVAKTPSAAAAQSIVRLVQGLSLISGASVETSATSVTITSRGYAPAPGRLADAALFRTALADAVDRPVLAAYVDVPRATATWRLTPAEAANLRPVKAIGISLGYDQRTLIGLARIIIR